MTLTLANNALSFIVELLLSLHQDLQDDEHGKSRRCFRIPVFKVLFVAVLLLESCSGSHLSVTLIMVLSIVR